MKGLQNKRQVLHKQARDTLFKMFGYFKRDVNSRRPIHDVASCQD
jgi:hypothetical protein